MYVKHFENKQELVMLLEQIVNFQYELVAESLQIIILFELEDTYLKLHV